MNEIVPDDIVNFWFSPRVSPMWFNSTPEFDTELCEKFVDVYRRAEAGLLASWQNNARGALALVIVLDQFPLNMFRGKAQSFATESAAREVARSALDRGFIAHLAPEEKLFMFLPFMHSESLSDQDHSVSLFEQFGNEQSRHFAHHHRDIIRRFGRFPHRNAILSRPSTAEELAYLNSPEAFHG